MATNNGPYYGSAIHGVTSKEDARPGQSRDIYPELPQADAPSYTTTPPTATTDPMSDRNPATTPSAESSDISPHMVDGQLQTLVEAATATTRREAAWTPYEVERQRILKRQHAEAEMASLKYRERNSRFPNAASPHKESAQMSRKRKRVDLPQENDNDQLIHALSPNMEPETQQQQQQQQQQACAPQTELQIREAAPQQSISDARAAGIHSAAALFRQPSASSKKYTRPPMSKMFLSLELSPENFLHLQAAAKAYMLDERFPLRRDCVGQRGKGDSEMVKLRLWNCVRDFLDGAGNGDRFFGPNAEGSIRRTMVWPRNESEIIGKVIPLLRRMVTNERQRQYAIETRKGGHVDKKRRLDDDRATSPYPHQERSDKPLMRESPLPEPPIPPPMAFMGPPPCPVALSQYSTPESADRGISHDIAPHLSESSRLDGVIETSTLRVRLLVNIVDRFGKRLQPRIDLPAAEYSDFASFRKKVLDIYRQSRQHADDTEDNRQVQDEEPNVKVRLWMPDGRPEVQDDEFWKVGLLSAGVTEWMDCELRVLVEFLSKNEEVATTRLMRNG